MLYSLNKLNDILGFKLTNKHLDVLFDNIGFELESIDEHVLSFENVYIGKVLKVAKHKNADRLLVCQVDFGNLGVKQVICGDITVKEGEFVVGALEGSVVGSQKIKAVNLRGEKSFGMLLSQKELNIGSESDKIFRLSEFYFNDIKGHIGDDILNYLQLPKKDEILDIKVFINRVDCFGHCGLVREIIPFCKLFLNNFTPNFNQSLLLYDDRVFNFKFKNFNKNNCKILNLIPEHVPFYFGLYFNYSKPLLNFNDRFFIYKLGCNNISDIVDFTNFALKMFGQPMHAFDADKIKGDICIRFAKKGEEFTALDGNVYKLSNNDIVISDEEKILALAGIIGGYDSCVDRNTKNVIFELAYFDPVFIRNTRTRLNLNTDSCYIFERKACKFNLFSCVYYIYNLFKTKNIPIYILDGSTFYKILESEIEFDTIYFNRLIGLDFDLNYINLLKSSFFKVKQKNKSKSYFLIYPPLYREDVKNKADVCEELVKLIGINNIVATGEVYDQYNKTLTDKDLAFKKLTKEIRTSLVLKGLYEAKNFVFVNNGEIKLCNPLSSDKSFLTNTLIYNLFENLKYNWNLNQYCNGFFEINKIFKKPFKEIYNLAYVLVDWVIYDQPIYYLTNKEYRDIYKAVDLIFSVLCELLNYHVFVKLNKNLDSFEFFSKENVTLGYLKAFPCEKIYKKKLFNVNKLYAGEIFLEDLLKVYTNTKKCFDTQLNKFPSVYEDLSVVAENTNVFIIKNAIESFKSKYSITARIKDIYKIDNSKTSLTFQIEYKYKGNLTQEDVIKEHKKLADFLVSNYSVKLR